MNIRLLKESIKILEKDHSRFGKQKLEEAKLMLLQTEYRRDRELIKKIAKKLIKKRYFPIVFPFI